MNRTEITEGNPMSVTAFTEAIGLRATAPQKPVQARRGHVMTPEQWDRVILAESAARLRKAAATVRQPDPAPLREALFESTLGQTAPSPRTPVPAAAAPTPTPVLVPVTKDEISQDVLRAEQSFVWREPVTVDEFLSGADGQYRSPFQFRQQ